ncbi:MAG TPA: SIMPL domain-containing protein [Gemmataceae bacterium]|nr:SIMPL domain-containing protein [Gemmataceae bacterium]
MNRWPILLVSFFAIILAGSVVVRGQPAQVEPDTGKARRTITAVGSATVRGKPDSARVYLGVVTTGKTVADAREQNVRAVAKVKEAILALKLADLKTRTTDSRVSIIYAQNDRSQVVGYEVWESFSVLVKQLDHEKLGEAGGRILEAGLQNGANRGGEIEFFMANDEELRRQAMEKAVEAALANARAYATGAKVKIVEVLEIDGEYAPQQFIFGQGGGLAGGGATSSIVAGDWNVFRQVRVVCRY